MARALFAGFVATVVVSALIYANSRLTLLPTVDLLADIAAFNTRIGLPATDRAVWLTHVIIGIFIYGPAYAIVRPIMPGHGAIRGISFGIIAWLAMMVSFMPLAQHKIFAQDVGVIFGAVTFALHIVYGAVLGMSYAAISTREE